MKPLKDIGREMKFCDTDPGTPHILHDSQVIVLSLQDRRELVRESIMKWERTRWERLVTRDNLEKLPDMDEFLKSEGL